MNIFIMRGTSNSGKDYFCDRNFEPHTVLSSDVIRLQLLNSMEDQSQNRRVFEHLREILETRLSMGCPYTVINATNLKFKSCKDYLFLAKKYGASVTFISIDPVEIDVLKDRRNSRVLNGGLYVPDEVLERHIHQYHESIGPFIKEAESNENISFIRIDHDWRVIEHV